MDAGDPGDSLGTGPHGPMHVFRLTGPLDEDALGDLERGVSGLVAAGPCHVHLDVVGPAAISTAAILRLASLASVVRSAGGRFGARRSIMARLDGANPFAVTHLLMQLELEEPGGDEGTPVGAKLIPPPATPLDAQAGAKPKRPAD